MKTFAVYGVYSTEDYHPSFIDEFDTLEEAQQCVNDFETVWGRHAWIEEC